MKTATRNLEVDHLHIINLTRVMTQLAQLSEPPVRHLEEVVDIVKKFADEFHHAKEENLLFPLLGKKGLSPDQGPVAVMLNEHTAGRQYVKGMIDNILHYRDGNNAALQVIRENMLNYVALLNNHIHKENNILFRMADNVLSDAEQENLLSQFYEVEKEMDQSPAEWVRKINELAEAYGIPPENSLA